MDRNQYGICWSNEANLRMLLFRSYPLVTRPFQKEWVINEFYKEEERDP